MNVGNRQFLFEKHTEDASFKQRQLGIQSGATKKGKSARLRRALQKAWNG